MLCRLLLPQVLFHFFTDVIECGFGAPLDFIDSHDMETDGGLYRLTDLSRCHGESNLVGFRLQCAFREKTEFAELDGIPVCAGFIYHNVFHIFANTDQRVQLVCLRPHLLDFRLGRFLRQLDEDLPDLAGSLNLVIMPVVAEPGLKLSLFEVDLFGDLRQGQDQVGNPYLFRLHVTAFHIKIRLNLLVRHLNGFLQFVGREYRPGEITGLVHDAGIRGKLGLRHKIRCEQCVLQLLNGHILSYPGQEARRRQSASICGKFKLRHVESLVVVELGYLADNLPYFRFAHE